MICTGCACLCEDIEIKDGRVLNACLRGSSLIRNLNGNRAKARVDGNDSTVEKAIKTASELIQSAESPVIYGLDTTTIEAQSLAIKMAEKVEAYLDDSSTYCMGPFVEMILKGEVPSTTLDEVREKADMTIYWGADPFHSHPRHMSRFTYYPRGKFRQKGWEEDRYLAVIDVRDSHTSSLARKKVIVRDDDDFMNALITLLRGETPSAYLKDSAELVNRIKKSEFGVIIGGLGLRYGLKNLNLLRDLMKELNQVSEFYFIPMGCHPNMRGFNETLYERTGEINRYSFRDGRSDPEYSFSSIVKSGKNDVVVVIGSDPVSSLPYDISSSLGRSKLIVVDPRETLTTEIADVVIPSSYSGLETGGTMKRIDGVEIEFKPEKEEELNDVYILERLMEGV